MPQATSRSLQGPPKRVHDVAEKIDAWLIETHHDRVRIVEWKPDLDHLGTRAPRGMDEDHPLLSIPSRLP